MNSARGGWRPGLARAREIEKIAGSVIGIPWKLGASGPNAYDCWGLVRDVFRRAYGVELPVFGAAKASAFAYANAFRNAVRESIGLEFIEVSDERDIQDYDIALFGVSWGWLHCGVVLKGNETLVLHSREGQGVVCEPLNNMPLLTQFPAVNYFRYLYQIPRAD